MNTTEIKELKYNINSIKKTRHSSIKVNEKNSLSYIDRLNEGESASSLIEELMGTFQSRKKQSERSLKYFLEKCVENEKTIRKIKKLYYKDKHSVNIKTINMVLKKLTALKEKYIEELNRRCITKKEYGKRIRVSLELINEFNDYKKSVEILEHIFLNNTK